MSKVSIQYRELPPRRRFTVAAFVIGLARWTIGLAAAGLLLALVFSYIAARS